MFRCFNSRLLYFFPILPYCTHHSKFLCSWGCPRSPKLYAPRHLCLAPAFTFLYLLRLRVLSPGCGIPHLCFAPAFTFLCPLRLRVLSPSCGILRPLERRFYTFVFFAAFLSMLLCPHNTHFYLSSGCDHPRAKRHGTSTA